MSFSPLFLRNVAQGFWAQGEPSSILGFSNDTRTLQPGEIFVALKTTERDGHHFLSIAKERGASGAIVTKEDTSVSVPQLVVEDALVALQAIAGAYRQTLHLPIIGVTGSCGKTSTKDAIHWLLGEQTTFKTQENLNNTLGVPLMLTRINPAFHKAAVIEAGMNTPGEMATMGFMLTPDIGVVTCVAPVHLENLGSIEAIAFEKSRLLQKTKSNGLNIFPSSVLNYESFRNLTQPAWVLAPESEKIAFTKSNWQVWHYKTTLDERAQQTLLDLKSPSGEMFALRVPSISQGMVQNLALAAMVAIFLGISIDALSERLKTWQPPALRGQIIEFGQKWVYADCYNSNPVALLDACKVFDKKASPALPRLYLLGGMNELGPKAAEYHFDCGCQMRLRPQDRICLTGAFMPAFRDGLIKAGAGAAQISLYEKTSDMQPALDAFCGAVFLKGSKGFKLWELLPN